MLGDCIYTTDIYLDKDGYPRIKWQRRFWRMNRLMYTFSHGDIPDGKVVGHLCNNKGCINTNHLYLTDAKTNSTHAARDGLYRTGEQHPKAKINLVLAEEIRALYNNNGFSQDYIARMYGVSQSIVSDIILNKRWTTKES